MLVPRAMTVIHAPILGVAAASGLAKNGALLRRRLGVEITPMEQPGRGPAKKVKVQVRLVDEPDGTTLGFRVRPERVGQAAEVLRRLMPLSLWRFHLNIRPGGPETAGRKSDELRLDWHSVRPSTGHVVWHWKGQPVAVTLFLGGRDADDARAVEHWARVPEAQVPASLLKRIRKAARPLLATAYLRLSIGTAKGPVSLRVCWQGLHATAGIAEMIDERSVRHEMLLLGGKGPMAGDVGQRFAMRFPKCDWEVVLNEFRTAPRPLLATVTTTAQPQEYGAGAMVTAAALAAALFRRIGAF
jgi:hypothetical protein